MTCGSIDLLVEETEKEMLALSLCPHYGCTSVISYWHILKFSSLNWKTFYHLFLLSNFLKGRPFTCDRYESVVWQLICNPFQKYQMASFDLWHLLGWMLQRTRLSSPASWRREGLCMLQTWVQAPSQLQPCVTLSMSSVSEFSNYKMAPSSTSRNHRKTN